MPRKRIGRFTPTRLRNKKKRDRETVEQRERRLEFGRIRSGLRYKRRARMEVEMLHRLETMLQAEVVYDHDDDSDDSIDEPVCINVPESEISTIGFHPLIEFAENKSMIYEEDRVFETEEHPLEVTETEQKDDLKLNYPSNTVTNHQVSEVYVQLDIVKDEIIDETYKTFDALKEEEPLKNEEPLKEEDGAFCQTSRCNTQFGTEVDVFENFPENHSVLESVSVNSECDDIKNVVLLEESNCNIQFCEEHSTSDEKLVKSNLSCEPENALVHETGKEVERIYECGLCKNQYSSRSRLKMHSLIHELYPELKFRFKCRLCERRFSRKVGLKKHMLTHGNESEPHMQNLRCDICEELFSRKKSLQNHLLSHWSNRDMPYLYKCKECGEQFIRKQSLKMHESTHQPYSDLHRSEDNTSVYISQCDVCKKKFMTKIGMQLHIRKYHNNPLIYMFECEMESAIDEGGPSFPIKDSGPQR